MGLVLHKQWRQAISKFSTAYSAFADAYVKLLPTRKGDREFMTPKIWCVTQDLPTWIEEHQTSLLWPCEQAFESLHCDYLEFQRNYKIPKTGEEIKVVHRRTSSGQPPPALALQPRTHGRRTANSKRSRMTGMWIQARV